MEREVDILNWNSLRGKLKQKFPKLTNADLTWRHSEKEELLGMIANKLGKTKKELMETIQTE